MTRRLTVTLDEADAAWVDATAQHDGTSAAEIVRGCVTLAHHDAERPPSATPPTRRVSRRAALQAAELLTGALRRDLADLERAGSGAGDPASPGGWLVADLADLLEEAEESSTWRTTADGMRVARLRWRRGLRVRLVLAADGQLVDVLPEHEGARR